MPHYRRLNIEGGTFFFTVTLADRTSDLLIRQIDRLREIYRSVQSQRPFESIATCILPDHLHAVWTLPPGDFDFATRWRLIKSAFSRKLASGEHVSESRAEKGERGIWQRRYWEHTLRDENDVARHVDYIHFNPVKHGHADRVFDWPHSSFHRMVKLGVYPADWAGDVSGDDRNFGER